MGSTDPVHPVSTSAAPGIASPSSRCGRGRHCGHREAGSIWPSPTPSRPLGRSAGPPPTTLRRRQTGRIKITAAVRILRQGARAVKGRAGGLIPL